MTPPAPDWLADARRSTPQHNVADPAVRRRTWQAGCSPWSRRTSTGVIANAEPTPYDALADLVVREPLGTALPLLLAAAP